MISKELLSEVLNQNVTSVYKQQEQYRYTTSNINGAWTSGSDVPLPNMYELAHKCKEWAFKQGYELFSRILSNDNQMRGNCLVIRVESDPETVLTITNADTEPEAIFQACEYILKEHQCNQLT